MELLLRKICLLLAAALLLPHFGSFFSDTDLLSSIELAELLSAEKSKKSEPDEFPVASMFFGSPASESAHVYVKPNKPVNTTYSTDFHMSCSDIGLQIIRGFEGYDPYAYWDYSQWTYGYGCRAEYEGQYISEHDALLRLADQIEKNYASQVNRFAKTYNLDLNQNQFDALCSFFFNIGEYWWSVSRYENSDLKRVLTNINKGNYTDAEITEAFQQFCHAGGEFKASLYRRRTLEASLFCEKDYILGEIPEEDLYLRTVVNVKNSIYIRRMPSKESEDIDTVSRLAIVPIYCTDATGEWGYTIDHQNLGWIQMKYTTEIPEKATLYDATTVNSTTGVDKYGVNYSINKTDMTASAVTCTGTSCPDDFKFPAYIVFENQVYEVTSIGENAFSPNKTSKTIYIPKNVKSIAVNAFEGSEISIIYYDQGSYAEKYAVKSGLNATAYDCFYGHIYGDWEKGENPLSETSTCLVCGNTLTRTVKNITVSSKPSKIEYYEGDPDAVFDPAGLAIVLHYDSGDEIPVKYKNGNITIEGFSTAVSGECVLEASYLGLKTTFSVNISQLMMESISVDKLPDKTTYVEGSAFEEKGLAIRANYNNGTYVPVSADFTVSGFDPDKIGKQTLTVTYNGFKTTFTVTVKAKSPVSFTIYDYPERTEYYCGDAFDPFGLSIKVLYNNGTEAIIDHNDPAFSSLTFSPLDSREKGYAKVTFYYASCEPQSIEVLVIARDLESSEYELSDDYVSEVPPDLTVDEFTEGFEAGPRVKIVQDGEEIPSGENVPNGAEVQLWYNSDMLDCKNLVVTADVNADGRVGLSDYTRLFDAFKAVQCGKTPSLTDSEMRAADLNGDGVITLTDLLLLNGSAVGKTEVNGVKTKKVVRFDV